MSESYLVPRELIESAIDALSDEAEHDSHWQGIRDNRYDQPRLEADQLRRIIGVEPVMSDEETEAAKARIAAQAERGLQRLRELKATFEQHGIVVPEVMADL